MNGGVACARPGPCSESLFIFQPFELRPWRRAKGGGELFETTEIWFRPKKESHGGEGVQRGLLGG